MLFRQLFDHQSSTYTYLVAADNSKDAILIDPVREHADQYLQYLKELNRNLVCVLDTHVHADHVTAAGELQRCTGCDYGIASEAKLSCATISLHDDDLLEIAGLSIKAWYTPGHTDDSYCFVMDDRVFTGDTLLIRGTGRSDFQNGDANVHYHSLFQKLLTLPDHILVYPGHDYKGMTVSTIGEEKRYNPRLQVGSRAAYVELMNNLNLPKPKLIDIAVPANKQCGLTQNL